MSAHFPCPQCKSTYKSSGWLKKHIADKHSPQTRRRSIGGKLRKDVWDTYIGPHTQSICFCCNHKLITPFTRCNTFHAGHIISHYNGGAICLDNLLPICSDCNMNMNSENWDDYTERNGFPLRRCGKDPPIKKYIKGIVWIQSLVRMWIERKNPNSHWLLEWQRRNLRN
jgi:hypothetical protein